MSNDIGQIGKDLDKAVQKLSKYAPDMGDRIYHWVDGTHIEWSDGWAWTDGFWHGLLWLVHETTGDPIWSEIVQRSAYRFKNRLAAHETHNHDMGLLFTLSSVAAHKITDAPEAREMALSAARSLAARFNPFGQFIRAWNNTLDNNGKIKLERRGKAIIDTMMNLHLLRWASHETENRMFSELADAHARTTLKYLVRKDGSTHHSFDFDPVTGKALEGHTLQGYRDDSCWARGQAWALHGFAHAYAWTQRPEYLDAARLVAKYWMERSPESGIPPWDFDAPGDPLPDTSAGSIAACGLLELARYVTAFEKEQYRNLAIKTLLKLGESFLQPEDYFGLISNGIVNMPDRQGIGVSLIYGDYFYLEGLLRAQGRTQFYWRPQELILNEDKIER